MSASRRAVVIGALVAVVLAAVVLQGVNAAQEIGVRQQQTQAVDAYRAAVTATRAAVQTRAVLYQATAQAVSTRDAATWATEAAGPPPIEWGHGLSPSTPGPAREYATPTPLAER